MCTYFRSFGFDPFTHNALRFQACTIYTFSHGNDIMLPESLDRMQSTDF